MRRMRLLSALVIVVGMFLTSPKRVASMGDCPPDTCQEDNPTVCYQQQPFVCPSPPCTWNFYQGRCIYDGEGCYMYTVCDYDCFC